MDKARCEKCGKQFASQKNLKRHSKLSCKAETQERKWRCYLCGKEIKYRETIHRHNRNIHPEIETKADICGKCGVFNYPKEKIECDNHQPLVYRLNKIKPSKAKKGNSSQTQTQFSSSSSHQDTSSSEDESSNKRHKGEDSKQSRQLLCDKCGKTFLSSFNLKRHQSTNCHSEVCEYCSKIFPSAVKRKNHELTSCLKKDRTSKVFVCGKCGQTFKTKWEYTNHYSLVHSDRGDKQIPSTSSASTSASTPSSSSSSSVNSSDNASLQNQPWVDEEGNVDQALRDIFIRYDHVISRSHRSGNFMDEYNFRVNGEFSYETLHEHVREIYRASQSAFRINITFGFILKNIEDGSYRYFYAHNNEGVFSSPFTISNADDVLQLFRKINQLDILQSIYKLRPNTKWKVHTLTNIRYVVFKMIDKNLGVGVVPDYIKRKQCINSLDINPSTKKPYTDYYCAFRCLAFHEGHRTIYNIERTVKMYRDKWFIHKNLNLRGFRGVLLSEMGDFEKLFKVNVNVLELKADGNVDCLYRTQCRHKSTMYLNVHDNHLSYINDIRRYSRSYKCRSCEQVCDTFFKWKRHERTCFNSVHYCFPGKFYSPPLDLFDKLKNSGINVDFEEFYYPFFIVYDFESYLKKCEDVNLNANTQFTHEHVPISVSVCSNVNGFRSPYCIVDEGDSLLEQMFGYLRRIQMKTSSYLRGRYKAIFTALEDMLIMIDNSIEENEKEEERGGDMSAGGNLDTETMESNTYEPPSRQFLEALQRPNTFVRYLEGLDNVTNEGSNEATSSHDSDNCDSRGENENPTESECLIDITSKFWLDVTNTNTKILKKLKNRYKRLLKDLEMYCDVIPILGFNSSNYDLNLIKRKLFKFMDMYSSKASVIKKANSYVCIQTDKFRFLDISNYLAPGCSYAQFLKAYEVDMSKSFMCYEWFTSVEKLQYPHLPPFESFYSSIKQCNVLEEDYLRYQKLENNSNIQPPKTGIENYQDLQSIWETEGMTCFKDFLVYYNNLDTLPFVMAVQKVLYFYKDIKIHPFKEIVSLPGISRKLLLRDISPENIFALFSKNSKDLYDLFDKNIVGGPSIVFTRYHEADVTTIRSHKFKDQSKLCKKIIGMDCNSMYLDAFRRYPMPTGHFTRRRSANNFKKESNDKYKQAYYWLSYIMHKEQKHIQHQFNGGEVSIAPFYADGFFKDTTIDDGTKGTVYEFNGCMKYFLLITPHIDLYFIDININININIRLLFFPSLYLHSHD